MKRSTYYVFRMYTQLMGDQVLDSWTEGVPAREMKTKSGEARQIDLIDAAVTRFSDTGSIAAALVNKDPGADQTVELPLPQGYAFDKMTTLRGGSPDDYNDVGRENVRPEDMPSGVKAEGGTLKVTLPPHSVNIVSLKTV